MDTRGSAMGRDINADQASSSTDQDSTHRGQSRAPAANMAAWEKIKLHQTDVRLTVEDLAELLKDRTFVDFFNVFLCLPIFPQRMMYKFDENDFEFDPPLRKSKYVLDRRALASWLVRERLFLFVETDLAVEFCLCKELCTLSPALSQSFHRLDYDEHKKVENRVFVEECIGHVTGMCRFRHYLKNSPGEKVFKCLTDLRKFSQIPKSDVTSRWVKFREIQVLYFRVFENEKRRRSIWSTLSDGTNITGPCPFGQSNQIFSAETPLGDDITFSHEKIDRFMAVQPVNAENDIDEKKLEELDTLLLAVLKDYWLQKYAIHCNSLKSKRDKQKQSALKVKSQSDLAILRDVKNIDKALAVLQGNLRAGLKVKLMKARMNWKAMFPENQIDDTFLSSSEEVVTLHNDGGVTVETPATAKFEEMMQKYLADSSDSDININKQGNELANRLTLEGLTRSKAASKMKRHSSSDIIMRRINKMEQDALAVKVTKSNVTLFGKMLDLNFEMIPKTSEDAEPEKKDRSASCPPQNRDPKSDSKRPNKKARTPSLKVPRLNKRTFVKEIEPIVQMEVEIQDSTQEESRGLMAPIEEEDLFYQNKESDLMGSLQRMHTSTVVCKPSYKYKNLCKGYYRYDNHLVISSIAADSLGGQPFTCFLAKRRLAEFWNMMNFWNSAQEYLATKISQRDNVLDYIKFKRAKMLLLQYIGTKEERYLPCIPPGLTMMLQKLLPNGKGDDLVRDAQDLAVESLKKALHIFSKEDLSSFYRLLVNRRTNACDSPAPPLRAGSVPLWTGRHSRRLSESFMEETLSDDQVAAEVTGLMQDASKDLSPGVDTDRSQHKRLALQFAMFISDTYEEGLPVDELDPSTLEFDYDQPLGSLALKKLFVVERRDLVEERIQKRLQVDRDKRAIEVLMEETIRSKVLKADTKAEDSIVVYKRPFKRAGQWHFRPTIKPKSFNEILRESAHSEFFRRFLVYHSSETPFLFFLAVEELKNIRDPKARQQKLNQILRRYFNPNGPYKGIEALQCNADIIKEIPTMERVSPAMLLSAQAVVVRSMEERWATQYIETFDDSPRKSVVNTEIVKTVADASKRTWGKEKTRQLWVSFIRSIVQLRKGILNPQIAKMFADFLKQEAKNEIDKQRASSGQAFSHGVPVKKVIRNKLVDVTKLVSDAAFMAEAERYRSMCDDATDAARCGNYNQHDQTIIEMKAKTIIECFVDSELPPKIQINVTQEIAESITSTHQNNILERGLFHRATVAIFPIMVTYWKKFQTYRMAHICREMFITGPPKVSSSTSDHQTLPAQTVKVAVKQRPSTPDFINMGPIKVKRLQNLHEEDHPRMMFSLSHGARILLPLLRDQNTPSQIRRTSIFPVAGLMLAETGSNSHLGEFDHDALLTHRRRSSILPQHRKISLLHAGGNKLSLVSELPSINSKQSFSKSSIGRPSSRRISDAGRSRHGTQSPDVRQLATIQAEA